jgi:predicted phosphodiesterase
MKRFLATFILTLSIAMLAACTPPVEFGDTDEPFVVELRSDTLTILQLTDLHLTYGIDAGDRRTFETITKLVKSQPFDLIVLSGDLTLSTIGPRLFARLVRHMESLKTPWTFVFGNHETDFHTHADYLNLIGETEYLLFQPGPDLDQGGVGNFRIQFNRQGIPFYYAYFLDSHAEREEFTPEEGEYDYLKPSQVEWYADHVATDSADSVVYMHIPLRQMIDPDSYDGVFLEDKVYPQGVDTGFFAAMLAGGRSKAAFFGHDHLNDFTMIVDGILLGYGRITGHNAYGYLERGGRVFHVDESGVFDTYVLLESEVGL